MNIPLQSLPKIMYMQVPSRHYVPVGLPLSHVVSNKAST